MFIADLITNDVEATNKEAAYVMMIILTTPDYHNVVRNLTDEEISDVREHLQVDIGPVVFKLREIEEAKGTLVAKALTDMACVAEAKRNGDVTYDKMVQAFSAGMGYLREIVDRHEHSIDVNVTLAQGKVGAIMQYLTSKIGD